MAVQARAAFAISIAVALLVSGCASRLSNMDLLPAYCSALDDWAGAGDNDLTNARMLTIYNPVEESVTADWESRLGRTAGCFERDCLDEADRALVRSIMRMPNHEDTVWFADAVRHCPVSDRIQAQWYVCSSGSDGCTRLEVENG